MIQKKAEFVAVYGRRRVGKTFLIKNFFNQNSGIFFYVTGLQKGSLKEQLKEFSKQLAAVFYPGATLIPRKTWMDAFEDLTVALNRVESDKKIVLFFDEFPWMMTPRSRLLTALELYWNRYWVNDPRIKLIICGSATSWIIEKIINNKGGLHNRVTRTIHLKPFTLCEVKCYLHEQAITLNDKQILDLYFALGGIPFYWAFIRKGRSAQQNIDALCFQNDGALVNEFNRLFESLFEDPKPYIDLIRLVAEHRYGISQTDLLKKSKLPEGGYTVKRLRQLEEAGFIMSIVPYGRKTRGTYYIIDDEYCLFYLKWIEPHLNAIKRKSSNEGFWLSLSQSSSWKSWAGLAFESICYKHLDQIIKALHIPPGALIGSWRHVGHKELEDGVQIDLLFDRPDKVITLCEIKYSDNHFIVDKSYAQVILKKIELFKKYTKTEKQIFFTMVTTFGLKKTMYSEELIAGEAMLKDLFACPDPL